MGMRSGPFYSPQHWAKAFDGVNGHQEVVGKRLESHDEQ
jgi:hypothetical protein